VPVNPTAAAQTITPAAGGIANPAFDGPPEQESIEVNLLFDEDAPDGVDGHPDMPSSPVESFTMDTPSINSGNFYEELEPTNFNF